MGVLEDLGCHLIDLSNFLFQKEINYRNIYAHNYEANKKDYCSFSSTDGRMTFTCSYLMWKNTFTIDIFGGTGSIHLNGLNKWGGATLVHRERIFPSGAPKEQLKTSSGIDKTWKKDFIHFKHMISSQQNSFESDIKISNSIDSIFSES